MLLVAALIALAICIFAGAPLWLTIAVPAVIFFVPIIFILVCGLIVTIAESR